MLSAEDTSVLARVGSYRLSGNRAADRCHLRHVYRFAGPALPYAVPECLDGNDFENPPAIGDDENGHYSARPEYYGMLAFSLAGSGELLRTEVSPNSTEIKTYATRSHAGSLLLTLINKSAAGAVLHLDTKSSSRQATMIRLEGPAVDAKTQITLGGAEITAAGPWKAANKEVLSVKNGQLAIPLAATSAVILNFL